MIDGLIWWRVLSWSAIAKLDRLVEAGIRAILNFAPTRIEVPPDVAVRNVDLTRELEVLCYHIDRLVASRKDASSNDDR